MNKDDNNNDRIDNSLHLCLSLNLSLSVSPIASAGHYFHIPRRSQEGSRHPTPRPSPAAGRQLATHHRHAHCGQDAGHAENESVRGCDFLHYVYEVRE